MKDDIKDKTHPQKPVLYKVTGAFGDDEVGALVPAIILAKDADSCLLYHPKTKGSCASIEICKRIYDRDPEKDHYVSALENDYDGYINITSQKELDKLIDAISAISYTKTTRSSCLRMIKK